MSRRRGYQRPRLQGRRGNPGRCNASLSNLLFNVCNRMINEYQAAGKVIIGRGIRNILRKHIPVPLSSPQIPQNLSWDRIRAAAVGTRPHRHSVVILQASRLAQK
jgi:hypothetical protein